MQDKHAIDEEDFDSDLQSDLNDFEPDPKPCKQINLRLANISLKKKNGLVSRTI